MTEEQRNAKVPDGMSIQPPKQEQKPQPLRVKEFDLDPSLPTIQYPHYTNNNKTELSCLLIRLDVMATVEKNIPNDPNHPLYRDISNPFTEEELLTNTIREMQIQKAKQKADADFKKNADREALRAKLWAVKSEFMDLDVVKNSEEKILKRNLRKSTTYYEALGYGVAILIKESEKSE